MNDLTDQQLLRDYAEHRSEAEFAELVRRHVDLVYSAALRMVCDSHLAKDVTQAVFLALAQNARQLTERPVLSGWLHRTAQNIASKSVRTEVRRRAREQEAVAMNELLVHEPDAEWENIAPHLDTALGELSEPDRDALLLRYFERKSAREMAQVLNVSEEAAQKRVNRAVERLREFFSKRNVTIGASGLAVLISKNAVQAAPIGLFAAISSAVSLIGTAVQTSTAIAATKTIAMTTLQKAVISATVVVLAGTGIYEARQVSHLRKQNQILHQQQAPLAEQIQELQQERDEVISQLAALRENNERLNRNPGELLKLRGEVGTLRNQVADYTEQLKALQSRVADGQNQLARLPPVDEYNERRKVMTFAMKQLANAALTFKRNNDDRSATNFNQFSGHLGWFKLNAPGGDIGLDTFEFVSGRLEGDKNIIFRERTPHKTPQGRWERFYVLSDGTVEDVTSNDGSFEAWEQQHDIRPLISP